MTFLVSMIALACSGPTLREDLGGPEQASKSLLTVADTPSRAQTPEGDWIRWREHLIDGEGVNGGIAIRGADGLKLADLDRDGYLDVISVHEDSSHARIAFGSDDPDAWTSITLSEGSPMGSVEDVAVGDLNRDGWPDLVFACERGHLIYFQNPGEAVRTGRWKQLIPPDSVGRGSWLRVFFADMTGDGALEVLAANKGGVDVVDATTGEPTEGPTSVFFIDGDPLDPASWREQVLLRIGVPNTAMPVDIDGDGDLDLLAAARLQNRAFILENKGHDDNAEIRVVPREIIIRSPVGAPANWQAGTNAFHSAFEDLNHDGRVDLAAAVILSVDGQRGLDFGWLEQPESLDKEWAFHRIGNLLPDWLTGFAFGDIDGDGDQDVIAGGYSGVNILAGGYSGTSRDFDDPVVTNADSVGRIAWFANPGDPTGEWVRHDISRRVRGMYDEFIARDMDSDGDLDWVGTRGNSGSFDGVFWLEQLRAPEAGPAFVPARSRESRALRLAPSNWMDLYGRHSTTTAPNVRDAGDAH